MLVSRLSNAGPFLSDLVPSSPGPCPGWSPPPEHHRILCRPLLLPSIFPSIRVSSNESALLIRWLKYWNFSFSISTSSENSGLISFRIDWFDILAVKSLLQHHNLKAWVLLCSALFMVQLSHLYMSTWVLEKIKDFTTQIFVGKAVSLLFNTLSRFIRPFLPRNKCLLISWQQLLSAAILQTSVPSPKGKVCPSEGCLGYGLWWCLFSLGGMENRVTEPNIVRTSPPEGVMPGSVH